MNIKRKENVKEREKDGKEKEKRRKESQSEDAALVNLNGLFTIMLVTLAPGGAGPCRERDFFVYF
jgi:hypothetical protein